MDITKEQLDKLFELAAMTEQTRNKEVSNADISQALINIESKLYSFTQDSIEGMFTNKKILIADDLELSIYQLTTILKKIGIVPRIARKKDEALSEIQKAHFDCIILDLFMPDSEDGLELIKYSAEKRKGNDINTKIVVISGTDDDELINRCYEMGIDLYIQKDKNWHSKLLKFLSSSFQADMNSAYSKFIIDNCIASYSFKLLNNIKVFDSLKQNINSTVFSGTNNIIFDLKEITNFNSDNAYIFAEIYKICAENGGNFVLVNPSVPVKEALEFAYLEDVISYTNSIEEAVSLIKGKTNII